MHFFIWNLDVQWCPLLNLITIHHVQIVSVCCCVWLDPEHIWYLLLWFYVFRANFSATTFLLIPIFIREVFMHVDIVALLTFCTHSEFLISAPVRVSCCRCKCVGQHFINLSKPKYNVSWLILNCIQFKLAIRKNIYPNSLFCGLFFLCCVFAFFFSLLHMFVYLFIYLAQLVSVNTEIELSA